MKKTIAAVVAFAAVISMAPGLSAAEEAAPKKGPFAVADANGDGRLDLAEYTQMVSKRLDAAKAKTRFKELDKDGDGSLTRQEFRAGMEGQKPDGAKEGKPAKKPDAAPN